VNNRYIKAFFLALVIYIVIVLVFLSFRLPQPKEKKYIPIQLSQFLLPKPKKISKPLAKKIIKRKTKTNIIKKTKPKKRFIKTPKPKPKKIKTTKSIKKTKRIKTENNQTIPKLPKLKKQKKPPSLPSIMQIDKNFKIKQQKTYSKKLRSLYGDQIYTLDPKEIKYLEKNLEDIGLITQKYLEYPYLAAKLGMKGESILEFYLYPNGNISKIKLLKSSGYEILDNNSIDTVKEAYKEYPKPSVKTKIRLLVKYILE